MHFEEQYPNKPPGVKFISTMFHPNVYATGELCLDILQNRWSPTYDVAAILTSIQRYACQLLCPLFMLTWLTVFLTIPTRAHQPTSRRRICTRTTARNTTRECARRSRRAGKTKGLALDYRRAMMVQRGVRQRRRYMRSFTRDCISAVILLRIRHET